MSAAEEPTVDVPSLSFGPPDGSAPRWQKKHGQSRMILELPTPIVEAAMRRARRRRIPLAALVEQCLGHQIGDRKATARQIVNESAG